jgi:DNA replication and repair protein RecF
MSIEKLYTQQFRNLISSRVALDPKMNFILGDNGSGKSSLLESIFFLGHGKSFRTVKSENLIAHQYNDFVINVVDDRNVRIGVSKSKQQPIVIKINGENKTKLSELASNIAVQIITPESFKLFFGGPKERRRFIDLGLFHVEQSFSLTWKTFSKVLKHRNACLKASNMNNTQLEYWDGEFCRLSELLSQLRLEYIEKLTEELNFWLNLLLPDIAEHIEITFVAL